MPNHIKSRLILNGTEREIKEFIKFVLNEDSQFDFNKIIKQPEILDNTEFHMGILYRAQNVIGKALDKNKIISALEQSNRFRMCFDEIQKDEIDDVIKCLQAYKETGYLYWHDWRIDNWGTKWNAYETTIKDNIITFETAWSNVSELIRRLSLRFPKLEIDYSYADEDTGSNTGRGIIKNGISHVNSFENGSNKSYEIAFELRPGDKEYYKIINGKYEYKEEENK